MNHIYYFNFNGENGSFILSPILKNVNLTGQLFAVQNKIIVLSE